MTVVFCCFFVVLFTLGNESQFDELVDVSACLSVLQYLILSCGFSSTRDNDKTDFPQSVVSACGFLFCAVVKPQGSITV